MYNHLTFQGGIWTIDRKTFVDRSVAYDGFQDVEMPNEIKIVGITGLSVVYCFVKFIISRNSYDKDRWVYRPKDGQPVESRGTHLVVEM